MKSGSLTYIFLVILGIQAVILLMVLNLLSFDIKVPFFSFSSASVLFFGNAQNTGVVTIPGMFLVAWPLVFLFSGLKGLAHLYEKVKLNHFFSSLLCLTFGGIFIYVFSQNGAIVPFLFGVLILFSGIYLLFKLIIDIFNK